MDMIIDQQVALDEALVPHANRLRIEKSNFRLRSEITSKESNLQLVYDVLRLTPFYKAFLVTADVPEIYMQEFWATAIVHHHLIRFKMDNKKRIVNLEYFREMLHICPRLPGQTFDELPFEEEILAFLRFLGHSGEIRKLTNVNINKLHQPYRSFTAVINKCLSGKSTGCDSLRNYEAYKEYYVIASGAVASVRKTKSSSDTTITPLTIAGIRLSTSTRGKQPAKSSKAKGLTVLPEVAMTKAEQMKLATKRSLQQTHISQASGSGTDEGTSIIPGVPDVPTDESEEEISWKSSDADDDDEVDERRNDDDQDNDNDGDDFVQPKLSIHEEESKDEEIFDPIVQTPKNSDDESLGLNVGGEERRDAEDDDEELYRDVNINLEGRDVQMADVYTTQELEDIHVTLTSTTPRVDVQASTTVAPFTLTASTLPPSTIPTISQTLKANFFEFVKTNKFAGAVSSILGIVERYMDQRMNEAIKILIEKMESNKSIYRFDEQRNLYKALVDAYECDKIILDTYRDTVTLKRRQDDADKDEEPFAGSDRGSKRRSEGKEPESTSAPKEKATETTGKSTQGSKSHQKTTSESAPAEEPMQTTQNLKEPSHQEFKIGAANDQPIAEASQHPEWFQQLNKPPTPDRAWNKTLPVTHGCIQPWISDLVKQADSRSSFNELIDTPVDFLAFLMNRLKVNTLTPELLVGPTYELMKRSCKSLVELEFFLEEVYKAPTYQLDWNNPEGQRYPHNLLKPLPLIPNSRGRRVIHFDHFINNDLEYLHGGASSGKCTTSITKTKTADYRHIKWIEDLGANVNSSTDLLSTGSLLEMSTQNVELSLSPNFRKAGKSHGRRTLCFQHLSRNVYKKHRHPMACGRSSARCQKLPKEAQPHKAGYVSFRFKRKEAYTAYSNPRGFIYQNKDKQNRLMRIDELHKFSDGTLNGVRTALDDRLKGIWIKYLPQAI
uniref:Uncharacterized protein n=1 Tax=Tanacetum cinerariifolium TaxID=118510 RepID=A0A6L2M0L0_TANCI|nr:hypothetical protein [Tanacetum cinerariifolium]